MTTRRPYPRRTTYGPGQRYFGYTIIGPAPPRVTARAHYYSCWLCRCDCGTEFTTTTKQIKRGAKKSCGCRSLSSRFKTDRPLDEVLLNRRLCHYKQRAKRAEIPFALDDSEAKKLLASHCYYCGASPKALGASYMSRREKTQTKDVRVHAAGIDRLDSRGGYVPGNVVASCFVCNRAKGSLGLAEFIAWARRLAAGLDSLGLMAANG
jgi:hypothetical protein